MTAIWWRLSTIIIYIELHIATTTFNVSQYVYIRLSVTNSYEYKYIFNGFCDIKPDHILLHKKMV